MKMMVECSDGLAHGEVHTICTRQTEREKTRNTRGTDTSPAAGRSHEDDLVFLLHISAIYFVYFVCELGFSP